MLQHDNSQLWNGILATSQEEVYADIRESVAVAVTASYSSWPVWLWPRFQAYGFLCAHNNYAASQAAKLAYSVM